MAGETGPIPVVVRRYDCPHCGRYRRAKKQTVAVHIGRCWDNPETRACRTCANLEPATCCGMPDLYQCYTPMCPESDTCAAGVDLFNPDGPLRATRMVTGCPQWVARTDPGGSVP